MDVTPRVSLVIPGRNCSGTLGDCLDAVVRILEHPDSALGEILFVDDGSTDGTSAVAAGFPVRVLHGSGQGAGAARNIGWRAAAHELVWFVDADWVARPDALDRLLPHLDDPAVARVWVDSLAGAASITLPLVAQGRYVKVQHADASGTYLSLAEVQVLGTTGTPPPAGNLALGRPPTQVSTGFGGDAAKAVDGNTDGRYSSGSVTHTNSAAQAWWQVDLGQVRSVESVRVFNRTDCCSARLSNFHVFVSATDMSGRSVAQLLADPAVKSVLVGSLNGLPDISLALVAQGRFVKLQLAGADYLALAEVQVFGR